MTFKNSQIQFFLIYIFLSWSYVIKKKLLSLKKFFEEFAWKVMLKLFHPAIKSIEEFNYSKQLWQDHNKYLKSINKSLVSHLQWRFFILQKKLNSLSQFPQSEKRRTARNLQLSITRNLIRRTLGDFMFYHRC